MDDLFALARAAAMPPEGARERVLERVLATVPSGPGGGGAATAPPVITGGGAALAGALVFALAGLVGGGLYLARTRHAPPPEPVAETTAPTTPITPLPVATPTPVATPSAIIDLDSPRPTRPLPSANTDTLAEELKLIRSAQSSLGAGNASAALQTLAEHASRFPRGKLAQEREVTRVRALCKAGRLGEAQSLYRALAKGAPTSPHLASLRASCPGLAED